MKKLLLCLLFFTSFNLSAQNKKELNATIERMKTDSITLQDNLTEKSTKINKKTAEINNLLKEINKHKSENNKLIELLKEKEVVVSKLKDKNIECQSSIDQLVIQNKSNTDGLNVLIEEEKENINILNDKIKDQQTEINELNNLINKQINEIAVFQATIQGKNTSGHLINERSLGTLHIGDKINLNLNNYEVNKTNWENEIGEEMGLIYEYSKVDFYLLGNDLIEHIGVNSNEFKTLKGIGVGATIKEFTEAYSVIKIWCEYDTGLVLETEELKDIWFYTNHSIDKINSNWSNIEINELDLNKEIVFIKIF